MKIVITGGAGFLGLRLAQRIAEVGGLAVDGGPRRPVEEFVLVDRVAANELPPGARPVVADIAEPGWMEDAIGDHVDGIFHMAAVVSAQAEADFDLGMRINVDATRALLEYCRRLEAPPRLVFPSSVASFGPVAGTVTDATPSRPQNSYGIEKVIGELLVTDYSRRGWVDGRCVRLPTIAVRPGKPNQAASSFVSSIVREPMHGEDAILPVDPDLALWIASPRAAIGHLIHAFETPAQAWGPERVINLPGLTTTAAAMIAALKRAGGDASLVHHQRDAAIEAIVGTWPGAMQTDRAHALGFEADTDVDAVVQAFVEDDLEP